MLVLSRKVGERILIGDQIAVTIVRVTGGGVRVGIEAPSHMTVLRAEIKPDALPVDASGSVSHGSSAHGSPIANSAAASATEESNTVFVAASAANQPVSPVQMLESQSSFESNETEPDPNEVPPVRKPR